MKTGDWLDSIGYAPWAGRNSYPYFTAKVGDYYRPILWNTAWGPNTRTVEPIPWSKKGALSLTFEVPWIQWLVPYRYTEERV